MVDVYITYDRYEHNEWFYVYNIDMDKDDAYNHCIKTDLPDFIGYGPDDCHSFQLQRVSMTKKDLNKLKKFIKSDENGEGACREFEDMMTKIFEGDYETELILSTDGQSDFFEIMKEYCGPEPEYDDFEDENDYHNAYAEYQNKQDELMANEEEFLKAIKEHIVSCY